MAAHVFVIDAAARRQQIKTTPATYLRDVLEDACSKFAKDPDQFVLTDSSRPPKVLDLSLTMRLSGLVNGAKLQLVQASRSPTVINVALKLPPSVGGGQRLQDKFPSNTSLWLVLRKFEEAVAGGATKKLNLTQRGVPSTDSGPGRLEYEQPVVKIMQREMADFVALQKTLAQLGYNTGSVLLNLDFRKSGLPMEQAVEQISQYFGVASPMDSKESQVPVAAAEVPGATGPAISSVPDAVVGSIGETSTANATKESDDSPMPDAPASTANNPPAVDPALTASSADYSVPSGSQSTTSTPAESTSHTPDPNGISVYKPPSASMPRAALQSSSESDFIPTIEHAQAHQAVLNRAAQNQRLLSDAEMEAEAARKQEALQAVRTATVRVRFPDQMQVDVTVDSSATAASLYSRVRDMLRDPALSFELRYPGPKGTPAVLAADGPSSESTLIRGLGWRGRVLVTMSWGSNVSPDQRTKVLKATLVEQARELALPVHVTQGGSGATSAKDNKAKEQGKTGNSKADVEAKMKKFLGFGKGKK